MDRRQLLKSLAVLPLARLSYAYTGALCNGTCSPVKDSLLVWLEGPFAVVLDQDDAGNSIITAFNPVDIDHQVSIASRKGPLKGAYPSQFHLSLQGDGVKAATTACISSDFKDFCADHLGDILGDPENTFVRVQMPLPKNIYTSHAFQATLANGGTAWLPQDHVFEYETVLGQPITLVDEDRKQSLSPNAKNVFHIEVGLPKGSIGVIAHATHFHNKAILVHCKKLQNDPTKQITDIDDSKSKSTTPKEILSRLPYPLPIVATTLECKSGGIIGGSP